MTNALPELPPSYFYDPVNGHVYSPAQMEQYGQAAIAAAFAERDAKAVPAQEPDESIWEKRFKWLADAVLYYRVRTEKPLAWCVHNFGEDVPILFGENAMVAIDAKLAQSPAGPTPPSPQQAEDGHCQFCGGVGCHRCSAKHSGTRMSVSEADVRLACRMFYGEARWLAMNQTADADLSPMAWMRAALESFATAHSSGAGDEGRDS